MSLLLPKELTENGSNNYTDLLSQRIKVEYGLLINFCFVVQEVVYDIQNPNGVSLDLHLSQPRQLRVGLCTGLHWMDGRGWSIRIEKGKGEDPQYLAVGISFLPNTLRVLK